MAFGGVTEKCTEEGVWLYILKGSVAGVCQGDEMRVSVAWHNMEVWAVKQEEQEQEDTKRERGKAEAATERDREKRR